MRFGINGGELQNKSSYKRKKEEKYNVGYYQLKVLLRSDISQTI